MARLLSGQTLRKGGSGQYITLAGAQPQLPPTETTSTGFTLVTDDKLITTYRSSLGNIQMRNGEMYTNLPNLNLRIIGTDSNLVIIAGGIPNVNTYSGALIVEGGIGIQEGIHTGEDIYVNGLRIGKGFEGRNNIVIRGEADETGFYDDSGQESIAIGYDSLNGLSSAYQSIAIGRYALNSGTKISRTIAIGDSALKNIGNYQYLSGGTIEGITLSNPVLVTATNLTVTTGTNVFIFNVQGTEELNEGGYYIKPISTNTVELYYDINLNSPIDGTGFTPYISGGTLEIPTRHDDNIAIGSDAGRNLINGERNFLLGQQVAQNLTTGSNNILIGHEITNNLFIGSGNIAIGGDNLVNGRDNQVNLGSVFYYDGEGYTQINSNLGTGIGTLATATIFYDNIVTVTQTNPAQVETEIQGISSGTRILIKNVVGMSQVNNQLFYAGYAGTGTNSSHFAILYYDENLTQPVDADSWNAAVGDTGEVYVIQPTGSLAVLGGVGIDGNLITTDDVDVYGGMFVQDLIRGVITTATNLLGGSLGSLPYQLSSGKTGFIGIGLAGTILTSNGTTATWTDVGDISVSASSSTEKVLISTATELTVYYPALTEGIGGYQNIDALNSLSYVTTTENTSSYWTSGTNVLNVPGSIYSQDGNTFENNLLYTPRVTVSATPPTDPRVGDFWIDSVNGVELQWINDGGNRFWIQFTGF